MEVIIPGTGRDCAKNDWAALHWRAFRENGNEVENTRLHLDGNDRWFRVGAYELSHCFEIAIA